jgi:hypothetical protein
MECTHVVDIGRLDIMQHRLPPYFLVWNFQRVPPCPCPACQTSRRDPFMMIFSAIPWALAGGLLGPFAAAGIGMLSGLIRGIWDTHSLFTVIDLGLMGTLFAVANRQRYRTFIYRLLRQPLVSALSLTLVHALLFVLSCILYCFHYCLCYRKTGLRAEQFWRGEHGLRGEMLVAGLVAQVIAIAFPSRWGELGMLPAFAIRKEH